ncbi:MAG: PT domain-containing protein [Clostridiales bacterium]|nr:PT domain-containing protein [Clostridiales bacterium]
MKTNRIIITVSAVLIAVLMLCFAACAKDPGREADNTEAPATELPTTAPTENPTEIPTEIPSEAPTEIPTEAPTEAPTETPEPQPAVFREFGECSETVASIKPGNGDDEVKYSYNEEGDYGPYVFCVSGDTIYIPDENEEYERTFLMVSLADGTATHIENNRPWLSFGVIDGLVIEYNVVWRLGDEEKTIIIPAVTRYDYFDFITVRGGKAYAYSHPTGNKFIIDELVYDPELEAWRGVRNLMNGQTGFTLAENGARLEGDRYLGYNSDGYHFMWEERWEKTDDNTWNRYDIIRKYSPEGAEVAYTEALFNNELNTPSFFLMEDGHIYTMVCYSDRLEVIRIDL